MLGLLWEEESATLQHNVSTAEMFHHHLTTDSGYNVGRNVELIETYTHIATV